MNGKPKSPRAMQLAAFHCAHPDLDSGDSALLAYLALNADSGTGRNSRPGNFNTSDVMKLQPRATIDRLNKNIGRGLIERTETGTGRGKASVYRLCLESSYYPDRTPSGEELIEVCSPDCILNPESVQSGTDKCAVGVAEVCSQVPENIVKCAVQAATHLVLPPKNPPPPPIHSQNGGGGVSSQEQATIKAKYLTEQCPNLAFGKETELVALIQEHGFQTVNAALFRCSKESFDGVRNPVAVVFSHRLPKMIAEMKADYEADIAKKQTQEIEAAFLQKQIKELDDKSREEHERIAKKSAEQEARHAAYLASGNIEDIF